MIFGSGLPESTDAEAFSAAQPYAALQHNPLPYKVLHLVHEPPSFDCLKRSIQRILGCMLQEFSLLATFLMICGSALLGSYWTVRIWQISRLSDEELDALLRDDLQQGRRLWSMIRSLLFPPSLIGV